MIVSYDQEALVVMDDTAPVQAELSPYFNCVSAFDDGVIDKMKVLELRKELE